MCVRVREETEEERRGSPEEGWALFNRGKVTDHARGNFRFGGDARSRRRKVAVAVARDVPTPEPGASGHFLMTTSRAER